MKRSLFEERKALPFRGRRHTVEDVPSAPPATRSASSDPLELDDATIPSALLQEINIMKRLAHPNLVKLKEIINDEHSKYLFLVLEHMQGGTVMIHDAKTNTYVYALTKKVMLEGTARRVFKELASALSYMHANHIAHRDIKPDNLLIDFNGKLKLSDFGVSTHFESDRRKHSISMKSLARSTSRGQMQETEGTFNFYSPEMCKTGGEAEQGKPRGYNAYMADLWASAVCLWIFVFGSIPFHAGDVTELFRMIREDMPVRPHRLSPELDNLLGLMMRKEVERRLSCMDVRHHCWLTETPLAQHAEVILMDSEVDTMRALTAASALSTAVHIPSSSSEPAPTLGGGARTR
jgi:[calcium/calmodulin-dependent protein kinase] kinase